MTLTDAALATGRAADDSSILKAVGVMDTPAPCTKRKERGTPALATPALATPALARLGTGWDDRLLCVDRNGPRPPRSNGD